MKPATPATAVAPEARSASAPPGALLVGCLQGLVFLHLVQLAAGLAGVDPKPPAALLPLIAGMAALGVVALPLVKNGQRLGLWIGSAFCLVSMIGMGPHKLFLDDGLVIAPVAIVGFLAAIAFLWFALRALSGR